MKPLYYILCEDHKFRIAVTDDSWRNGSADRALLWQMINDHEDKGCRVTILLDKKRKRANSGGTMQSG